MRGSRTVVACLLATMLVTPLQAQDAPRGYRKYLFAAAGAVALGGIASLQSDRGEDAGACSSRACLSGVGAGLGATIGLLIGHDLDMAAARRWGAGATLAWTPEYVGFGEIPERMVGPAASGLLATRSGLVVALAGGAPRLLMPGARVYDAAVDGSRVLVASAQGLLAAPLLTGEPVDTLDRAPTGALALLSPSALLLGQRAALRRVALGSLPLREEARGTIEGLPTELHSTAGAVWSVSGGVLAGHDPATLAEVGRIVLPGTTLDLAVDGGLAAVASGTEGAVLLDVSRPAEPRIVSRLAGMRSATSVALGGGRAYVAAGGQGLFVFELADPAAPILIGSMRDFGFAAEVRLEGGRLYVLDRARRRIYQGDPHAVAPESR